jgi:hypothetical protein
VLRETPRSRRTLRYPPSTPGRRSLESRKLDNQILCSLICLVQLATLNPRAMHNGLKGKSFRGAWSVRHPVSPSRRKSLNRFGARAV